jgi:hypothetical protein
VRSWCIKTKVSSYVYYSLSNVHIHVKYIMCYNCVYVYLCVDYICCRATYLLHMQGMGYENLYVFIYCLKCEILCYLCYGIGT